MQAAAIAFVEYLVSGSVAMLWLSVLIGPEECKKISGVDGKAVIAIAGLYVLGMMVDFLSARLISPLKKVIKRRLENSPEAMYLKRAKNDFYSKGAALMHLCKELGAEHRALSSRDRMARGTFLNLLVLTAILGFSGRTLCIGKLTIQAPWTGIGSLLALAVWWQYENHSQRHKQSALATVLQLEEKKSQG